MADKTGKRDTFTLREMREAFKAFIEGKALTEKQAELAQAMSAAVRSSWPQHG